MQASGINNVYLLGPLTVDVHMKVQNPAGLIGDVHIAKNQGLTYGGIILRMARLLKNLGYPAHIFSYLGNDEFGNKIIQTIKEEGIESNIQKIPNTITSIATYMHDKKDFSSYITEIKDLTLWKFRLKSLPNEGIIFIHPIIPTELQLEIIQNCKNATIVVKKPLDGKLDIFYSNRRLIILLNEYEAFQIFTQLHNGFFASEKILQSTLLSKHSVLIESKHDFATLNDENKILKINLDKIRINYAMLNEYCIAGILGALCAKNEVERAFLWGLSCSIQIEKKFGLDKLDILSKSMQFEWQEIN